MPLKKKEHSKTSRRESPPKGRAAKQRHLTLLGGPLSPRLPIGLPALAVTCTGITSATMRLTTTDIETKPVLLSPSIGRRATLSLNHLLSSPVAKPIFSPENIPQGLASFPEPTQGISFNDAEALVGKPSLASVIR